MKADDITLSTVQQGSTTLLLVYDMGRSALMREATDFSIDMTVRLQLSLLTVKKRMGQLSTFIKHVQCEGWDVDKLSDSRLARFRDHQLKATLARPSARANVMTAKRTVNDCLRTILLWVAWLRETGRASNQNVTIDESSGYNRRRMSSGAPRQRYGALGSPVLFKRVGTGSKHKVAFVPDNKTLEAVQKKFLEGPQDPYVAHRNALIAEIANSTGLRRGSINSLTARQFDRSLLLRQTDSVVMVTPSSQKFGYSNEFAFPLWLALRICDFIETYRRDLMRRKGATQRSCDDRIFLSARDARPLTNRAISQAFSVAMRSAGAPKGVALHSLRAKFASDQVDQELDVRTSRGMDTSSATIAAVIALRLGQRNPESIFPYVAKAQSTKALRTTVDLNTENRNLREQLESIELENDRLRRRLIDAGAPAEEK